MKDYLKNDNKTLLFALVIIVLLIIVSLNNSPVGLVVSDFSSTNIEISPDVVHKGEKLFVTVYPSNKGVNEKISFYLLEDNLRKTSVEGSCNNYKCSEEFSFSFFIPNNWENGVYYVQVYDYGLNEFIRKEFTVDN